MEGGVLPRGEKDVREKTGDRLSPEEMSELLAAKGIAQPILLACYVNAELVKQAKPGYAGSKFTPDELSMNWMLNTVGGQRFSKVLGELVDIAAGQSEESVTQAQRNEAVRFTRMLLELGRSNKKPIYTETGFSIALTGEEQDLVDRLQAELNRRDTQPAEPASSEPTLH